MHIAAAVFYGLTIWAAMLLFSLLSGEFFWTVVFWGPVIVSGAIGALYALDWAAYRLLEKPDAAREERPAE